MPEGDTIFRAARTLNLALAARTVTRFTSVYPALTRIDEDAPIAGRVITSVDARGKHLLMHFGPSTSPGPGPSVPPGAGPLTLRTHMRMSGSWHPAGLSHSRGPRRPAPFGRDRPGERWQLPPGAARIVIETAGYVAVAFNVPVAEFLDASRLARQEDLRRIGPDLLGETFDEDEALARLRGRGAQPIAEALLKPCRRCGMAISYARTGPEARGTYWCHACQVES